MKEQVLLNTNNMLVIITHFSNENSNTATYHYSAVVPSLKSSHNENVNKAFRMGESVENVKVFNWCQTSEFGRYDKLLRFLPKLKSV